MKLPDIVPGTRVTAALLTKIARQANAGASLRTGRGLSFRDLPGGPQLSLAAEQALAAEPAQMVLVVNTGQDPIDAYCPAGIVESLGKLDGELQAQRCLSVRYPKARDAGDIVIAAQRIEAGGAGWAYCAGTCLVRLYRWFNTSLLDKADILAGQRYALATIDGPLDIVWSQKIDDTNLIVDREHFAVVRFNGRRALRWFNSGTADVPFGSPISLVKAQTDGLVTGVLSARLPNSADTLAPCFINVGGTVKAGEFGKCTAGIAMARAKASYNALDTVGAEQGQTSVSNAGNGLFVVARLGTSPDDGLFYAVVNPAGGSALYYHLQAIDGQTVYSDAFVTYYGGLFTGSTLTTVPTLYDPNAVSSTPGSFTAVNGIFRAKLYVNDVSQSGFVLALNDGRAGNLVRMGIYNGEQCEALAPVTLSWVTDPTQSVQAYPVKFM